MSEELSFASAEELFEALENPNAIERRPVLAWVATHREEAIALGPVDGRNVVDLLIGLVDREQAYGYWQDLAITIGVFDAPEVTGFFADMLAGAREGVEAQDAANALSRRDRTGLRDRLVEIVLSDDLPERSAAAAELLAGEEDVPERAAVRVAALEEERPPPPLGPSAADAWVEELAGPFAEGARDRLTEQGEPAVRLIAERWDRLDDDDRGWLLEWATEVAPGVAEALISRAPLLGRWSQHADPAVAAIRRLAEEEGAGAVDRLAEELANESPDVRAAAREEIVALGPAAIEALRPLVHSPSPEVRAGAVRALLDLGDDEWLERELLSS